MSNKIIELEPEKRYHIFNRANGNEKCFQSENNYFYFLKKYKDYIHPIADTFSYCLLPNHFHFAIRVKNEEKLNAFFKNKKEKAEKSKAASTSKNLQGSEMQDPSTSTTLTGFRTLSGFISKQFSNLFNTYTQAFNKAYDRKGSLFIRPFKRKPITSDRYFIKVIHYIHYNPIEAKLCSSPDEWKFSSYNAIIGNKKTLIQREEVLKNFGGLENFIHCHSEKPHITGIDF